MVLADGDKLVRVFENLIINAIAYGNDGDYIDITAYENNNMIAIDITNYSKLFQVPIYLIFSNVLSR